MDENAIGILSLIKWIFWGSGCFETDASVYKEMKLHAITALPARKMSKLKLTDELRTQWKTDIYRQTVYNVNYRLAQNSLPISVPYVILKGTAAAKYYPDPEIRTFGDIDIITNKEDFEAACDELLYAGYSLIPNQTNIRHKEFVKDGIIVEVHSYYAMFNDIKQAENLDHLITENINPSHYLPDMINGLVLLEHIGQHLENGLGLRQIIDWMMFADKCLPDDQWKEFETLTETIGLKHLALIATRMCEMYLGLPQRRWCSGADEKLCSRLMEYVLNCGNFGNKGVRKENMGKNLYFFLTSPFATLRLLQESGMQNWRLAQKHSFLRPFAWIYQIYLHVLFNLLQKKDGKKFISGFQTAKENKDLFEALGVKMRAKGLAKYMDGKYTK